KDLAINVGDLPAGFTTSKGEYQDPSTYSIVYLRLDAVTAPDPTGVNLLSVVAGLSVQNDPATAGQKFTSQGNLDANAVVNDIKTRSTTATNVSAKPISVQISGSDRVLAFRVAYTL